jgi:hypothetical protein
VVVRRIVDTRKNELILTTSFATALARVAANLDDPEVCDEHLLFELLALGDRAEEALARLVEAKRRGR